MPSQTVEMDPAPGKYHLSMLYRDATDSLERFTMGREIALVYPDCRAEMVLFDEQSRTAHEK